MYRNQTEFPPKYFHQKKSLNYQIKKPSEKKISMENLPLGLTRAVKRRYPPGLPQPKRGPPPGLGQTKAPRIQPLINWADVKINPWEIPDLRKEIKSYEDACSFEPRNRADIPFNDELKRALVRKLWDMLEADVQTEAKNDSRGMDGIRYVVFKSMLLPHRLTREQAENLTFHAQTKGQICKLLHTPGMWI